MHSIKLPEYFISELNEAAKHSKLRFFFGAGASYCSGLPLVFGEDSIVSHFLRVIGATDVDIDSFARSGLPFEAYIGIAARVSAKNSTFSGDIRSIEKLLTPFKLGEPGPAHKVIAGLMAKNFVDCVMTTNFDQLLEQAYFDRTGAAITTLLHGSSSDQPSLWKIHGSIDDIDSIDITLSQIGRKEIMPDREKALREFFDTGVLTIIFGYSCSDVFDITPILQTISSGNKIVFVAHSDDNELQFGDDLANKNIAELLGDSRNDTKPNPFSRFSNASWIKGNTNVFLQAISDCLLGETYDFSRSKEVDWRTAYDDWAQSLRKLGRRLILGELFNQTGQYPRVRQIGEEMVTNIFNPLSVMNGLHIIAVSEHRMGNFDAAIEYYKKCEPFMEAQEPVGKWIHYNNLQKLGNETNDKQLAEEYEQKADIEAVKLPHDEALQQAHARTKFNTRSHFHPGAHWRDDVNAITYSGGLGEPKGHAYSLFAHMRRAAAQGEREAAINFGLQALELGEKLGDPFTIATAENNLGHFEMVSYAHAGEKDPELAASARRRFEKAAAICNESNNKDGYFRAKINLLDLMMCESSGEKVIREEVSNLVKEAAERQAPLIVARAQTAFSEFLMMQDDNQKIDEGIGYRLEAATSFNQAGHHFSAAQTLFGIGGFLLQLGQERATPERRLRVLSHRLSMGFQEELEQAFAEVKQKGEEEVRVKQNNMGKLFEKLGISLSKQDDIIQGAREQAQLGDWASFDAQSDNLISTIAKRFKLNEEQRINMKTELINNFFALSEKIRSGDNLEITLLKKIFNLP